MLTTTILVTAYVAACIWLSVRRMEASGTGPKTPRGRVRELGWGLGLLALAISLFGLGASRWVTFGAMAIAGLVLILRPRLAAILLPVALVALGLYGFWVLRAYLRGSWFYSAQYGAVRVYPGSWMVGLILPEVYVFLAVGLLLLWRRVGRRSGLGTRLLAWPVRWRWLLLPVVAMVMELLGPNYWLSGGWGSLPWNAAFVALAVILVLRAPATAADLATLSLVAFGLYGIVEAKFWPSSTTPVTTSYMGLRYGAILIDSRGTAIAAGVEGGLLLLFGLWLAPRTIVAHARVLLRPEPPDAELTDRVEQLTQTRAHAVDSAAAELRRVERDLHDGAQARLVALGMNLRAAERLIPTSPEAAIALVAEARETSSRALNELRDLVRGIYPPVLADRGLADAIRALALDTPLRTETDIELPGRLEAPVEAACYFAIAEGLANAVKHSGARVVQVRIRHAAGMVKIMVIDNGVGGADPARGSGLAGIERRLGTFDGILAVSSPPGGPTMIVMEVPCALSSPRTSSY